jgi:hypothetical protein
LRMSALPAQPLLGFSKPRLTSNCLDSSRERSVQFMTLKLCGPGDTISSLVEDGWGGKDYEALMDAVSPTWREARDQGDKLYDVIYKKTKLVEEYMSCLHAETFAEKGMLVRTWVCIRSAVARTPLSGNRGRVYARFLRRRRFQFGPLSEQGFALSIECRQMSRHSLFKGLCRFSTKESETHCPQPAKR